MNIEGIKGEYRELTLEEIRDCVKNWRSVLSWTQDNLATESGVTLRTIERIEQGIKMHNETYRKVAKALSLTENAFIGPRYIKPLEQAVEEELRKLKDMEEKYHHVEVTRISDHKPILELMEAEGWLYEDSKLTGEAESLGASFKDAVTELNIAWDIHTASEQLEEAKKLAAITRALESKGFVTKFGRYKQTVRIGTKSVIGHAALIVFIPKTEKQLVNATHFLVPK